jgi:aspartate-semialdehyde dehydrogenase
MAELKKSENGSRSKPAGLFRVAVVGAATLKGKEVKDLLEERNFPAIDIKLLDDDEALGQLDAVGEEPTFIQSVDANSFHGVDLVFFAADAEFTRTKWGIAESAGCAMVDLSYGKSGLAIRSPWVETELQPHAERAPLGLETTALSVAHPAATMLALLLLRCKRAGDLSSANVSIFQPVSEQGRLGMDELHQQTLNLLSFQSLPKDVFDVQIAFNLLNEYGGESKASLEREERLIADHLKQITRGHLDIPALQVLQAPTFHGYAMSIYLEFAKKHDVQDVTRALAGEHIQVVVSGDEMPNNVNAAGQEEILLSVRADRIRPNGIWLWATADNLKLAGITALECGSALMSLRPTGKIQ